MLTGPIIGIVKSVNGLLEKLNSSGGAKFVKSGAPLHDGDILTLLSGNAYIQFIKGFPEALSLDKPVKIDGISPALKGGLEDINEEIIKEAIAKHIDPSLILDALGAAAAGATASGSGGTTFTITPNYGESHVTSGFETHTLSVEQAVNNTQMFWFRPESGTTEAIKPTFPIVGQTSGTVIEAGGVGNSVPGIPEVTGKLNTPAGFLNQSLLGPSITQLGTFTIDPLGNWKYSLHSNSMAVEQLKQGDIILGSFNVTADDGTTTKVDITIEGTNDAAVITGTSTGAITESNAIQSVGGSLTATDVDSSNAFVVQTDAAGNNGYGKFSINAAGDWTYTMNTAHDEFVAGQTYTDSLMVQTADGTTQVITVTMTGTNDAAVIGTPTVSTVTEDVGVSAGNLTAAGSISITDADAGQAAFSTTVTGVGSPLGSLVLAANGSYTYSVSNAAVQYLGASQTAIDTFTITSVDGTTKNVSFTINGTNDAAVIGTPTVSTVTEDVGVSAGNLTAAGSISITDADAGQAAFSTTVTGVGSPLGSLVLAANGSYTYSVSNAAVQYLGASQTAIDTFTITSVDGTTKNVSFTINGTNDAAVIGTPTVSTVTEDVGVSAGNLTAAGSISITDADAGQAAFSTTVTGVGSPLGSLVLAANGSYTYSVSNAAVQYLGASQTAIDTFTITSVDGTTKNVSFTINGTNDAAVIGTPTVSTVTEDVGVSAGNLTAAGSISITDADAGQAAFSTTVTGVGSPLGSLVLAANGSYTYSVSNAAVQYLGASQTAIDTFTITSVDGTTKNVSFTINGTNDAAVIGTPTVSTVTEDVGVSAGNLTAAGSISITDADAGQAAFSTTVTGVGSPLGSLVLAANGSYTYSVSNAAVQYLGASQTAIDTFTITSVDGTTKNVSFTINGTNDAAVIGTPTVSTVTEDVGVSAGNLTAAGSISITDADAGQAAFSTTVTGVGSPLGSLVLAANGSYTYSVSNAAVQYLGASQTAIDTFTITSVDGTTKNVSFTINGTNDAAVIGTPTVSTVTEDVGVSAGNLTAAGSISITDADAGQAAFSTTVTGVGSPLGSLVLAANGSYTYSVSNAAVQYLGASQTAIDTFTITSVDGTTKNVSFTINGTNDAAVIGTPTVSTVTEDVGVSAGNLTAAGSISITDADAGQAAFSTTVTGVGSPLGSLVLAANGSYTYSVSNAAVQYLGASQTAIDTFTITSVDGTTKNVSFTINGTNDAAVIGTPTVSTVTEDVGVSAGNLTAAGSISITDADAGQAAFSTTVTGVGSPLGSLVLAANGSYTYSVSNAAVQYLGASQTAIDTFTITSVDGTTKNVSFTINGVNDAAVIGTPTVSTVTEDVGVSAGNLTAAGSISITDADAGQAAFSTTVTGVGSPLGSLVLAANGSYTYSVSNAAVQYLGASQTAIDTFTITSVDGTTKNVSFTINGTNDAAVIGTPTVSTVTEDVGVSAGNLTAAGSISITDADAGQAAFSTTVTGVGSPLGSLVLAANGSYTYSVSNAAVQYLGASQTAIDTFTITSVDGTTKNVSFTINGANDAAVIGTPTVSTVTEDVGVSAGNLTAAGSISITDADAGQAAFSTTVTGVGSPLGSLVLAANGSYTYSVSNAAVQYLGASQTAIDTFTITSVDGTTKNVSFTINGVNDAAVIGTPTVSTVTEDVGVSAGNLTAAGSISITDADAGQAAFSTTVTGVGSPLGSLVLAANGSYTYSVSNAAVQYLGASQTAIDTFTITSVDGTTKNVSFTINGANDAPVIISSATVSVPENTTGVTTVVATDPDAGSVLTYSIVGGADLGKFSINSSTGALSFIAAPNFEIPTDVGANNIYDVIVQASDGTLTTSQAIAVRVTNVNEAPVNTVPGAQTTNEDISKVITGLSISDVDALAGIMTVTLGVTNGTLAVSGGSAAISGSGTSTVTLTGTVAQINSTLSAANSVTYVPTNNYSGTATLTMTTNDNGNTGSGGAQSDTDTVTINITAVADTPILSLPASVSVVNPGNFTISNTAAISQAGLETDLGLSSGFLDGFDPLAGSVASSDPGNVNVIDGALANSSYRLSNGAQIAFDWQFTNAENIQSEINGGYNDMVFLVVTLPNGTQQTFQITSSEQAGAGVNTTGTYTYTASQSGNYQFSWLVVNGLDNQKDSSLSITNTKTIISSTNYGKPISIPVINAALKDTDGSESLKVRISGVPSGGILSAGTAIGGGVWEFTNISDLTGLIYYPPTSFTTGNINLTVTATATEASNGSTATTSSTLTISVDQASTVTYGAETGTTTTGTAGNDWIHALPGNDTVNAAGGNDLVYGGAGDDTSLSGGAGNDTIYGGLGNDTISGGDGNDLLFGEAGDDNITGGTGNDMLYGGVGDDKLDGELGNDILVGGQGSDTLTGGGGIDTFVWLSGDNTGGTLANPIQDKITDFKANPVGGPSPDVSILNLSALLGGEHLNADSLDNYLNISKSGTGDTLIKIDPSGTDPVTNATQTILLQGVDLTNVFATTNSHEIITNLIANGNLITDA